MATKPNRTKSSKPQTTNRRRARGPRRIPPIEDRAYYMRAEVCELFGFSATRLAEVVANDHSLPMVRNGRNQLFPKAAFQAWYEQAASKRVNVHAA